MDTKKEATALTGAVGVSKDMSANHANCPTCGAPVMVASGDEGTNHYVVDIAALALVLALEEGD